MKFVQNDFFNYYKIIMSLNANGYVAGNSTYYSFGFAEELSYGVRPVVTLKTDIQLQSASVENGITTYNIKN